MKIKRPLVERLGVPEGILDIAEEIYPDILLSIGDNDTVKMLENSSIYVNGDFNINDFNFNRILFNYKIFEGDDLEIIGMSQSTNSKLTNKYKLKTVPSDGMVELTIFISGPKSIKGLNIKDLLEENKKIVISSLSHELKHSYDDYKDSLGDVQLRSNYEVYTKERFGIRPIDSFLERLYFTSSIESLVRPTEVASLLKMGNITKKGFYDFIKNDRTYKLLTELSKFNIEDWRNEIKEYIPEIIKFFKSNGVEGVDVLDEDEIVDEFLRVCYYNIKNWKVQQTYEIFVNREIERLIGFMPEKEQMFRKHLNKINRFGDDYKKYYEYEAKTIRYVADNLRKKIAKLFDMAKDEKNESIKPKKVIRLSEQDLISLLKGVLDNPLLKMISGDGSDRYNKKSEKDTESSTKISAKGQELLNNPIFKEKLKQISNEIGISEDSIIKLMKHESGLDSSVKNSNGCVGLIQFCPDSGGGSTKTINGKTYNLTELQNNLELQLDAIKEFWSKGERDGKIKNAKDLYIYNFFPVAAGKSDDYVLQTRGLSAEKVARENPIFNKTLGRPVETPLTVGDLGNFYKIKGMV
jgi:hypothetical protein